MVDGISEEIQQLIADHADAVRVYHELAWHTPDASRDDLVESERRERETLAALHVAIAELSEHAECQTLERESAEQELARRL